MGSDALKIVAFCADSMPASGLFVLDYWCSVRCALPFVPAA
jgi:hypothetical protein